MRTQLQLVATTIALTMLIWVYADQSAYDVYQTTVIVRYIPPPEPDNPLVVRVRDGRGEAKDALRVELGFRGPKSAVRRLEKDDTSGRFTLSVLLPEELNPGLHAPRDVYEDLSRLPEIRNRGVSLQRVLPRNVQLDIDRYRSVTTTVEISAGSFEKALSGVPEVHPVKVTARVLESQLPASGTLPPLRLSIEELLQTRAEGARGQFAFDVPLRSTWQGIDASFTPERVRVTARLGERTTSERITLIPLSVQVPPEGFFGKYEIEWQDQTGAPYTQTINVRMPLDRAGQLKGNMIDAYVKILDSDLPKELPGVTSAPATQESWIEREIRFEFPAEYESVKIEGPPRTVKFRIKKRSELSLPANQPTIPILPVPVPQR